MRSSEKVEFIGYITSVLAFYRQDVSDFVMDVWWAACAPYTMEQVRKALSQHATDPDQGRFAPKPADLVRMLGGTKTDRSQVAWGKVYEAMVHVGAYTDVCFDDGVIHAVVEDLGGWPTLCRTETKDLSYMQHRFCQSYQAYAGRDDVVFVPKLCGDAGPDNDQKYINRGLPVPAPVFIGDPQRCKQVMQLGVKAKTQINRAIDHVPEKLLLTEKGAA